MIFTIREVLDAIIMSFIVGIIFSDFFSRYKKKDLKKGSGIFTQHHSKEIEYDPISEYKASSGKKLGGLDLSWDNIKFSMAIVAPAIILHELGHKFVAIGFGAEATFHISYFFLGIALVLKLMNSPFIFLVPAFVAYPAGAITPLQSSMVAGAGPFVNLLIFLGSSIALKYSKKMSERSVLLLGLTKQVNLFLAIFNMIPFRPFDGGHFFQGIFQSIGL